MEQKERVYLQNITLGYYCLSDLKWQFAPREVKVLQWEKMELVKDSPDLEDAIRKGFLKKLNKEDYQKTVDMQYMKEKKELLRDQRNKPDYEKIELGEKNVLAETFDVSKASSKKSEKLDFSGSANDSLSYVTAYEIAEANAYERGETLTPEEFGDIVNRDPGIVPKLLRSTKLASSNTDTHHKVYFSTPPDGSGQGSGVASDRMSNYRRDGRYAGMSEMSIVEQPSNNILMAEDFQAAREYNLLKDKIMPLDFNDTFYDVNEGEYVDPGKTFEEEAYAEEIVIDEE
jgi:hypothetical protein